VRFLPANLLVAIALSLFTPTAQAATEIPFERSSGMVWVNVACAGHEPLSFLLDSGAGATVFDLAAARRVGLPLGPRRTVRGISGDADAYQLTGVAARVGDAPLAKSALAVDLGAISRSCGRHVDGLIGLDFFRARVVQIDYAARKIRLLDRAEAGRLVGDTVPLALRGDSACVRLAVGTHPAGWVRVDTGCDSAVEWVNPPTGNQKPGGPSIAAGRGSPHGTSAEVTLGTEHLANIRVGLHEAPLFAGEAGLIGNGLLSRYRVTFDLAKKRLLLAKP
jgi:hypothetical protein